jgi:hypothetical protein
MIKRCVTQEVACLRLEYTRLVDQMYVKPQRVQFSLFLQNRVAAINKRAVKLTGKEIV